MSTFWKKLLVVGIAALLAAPVFAQPPGGGGPGGRGGFGRGGRGGVSMLLTNKSVQDELKLTEDQVTKARDVVTKTREKYQDEMTKLRDLTGDERRDKMQALTTKISEETMKGLGDVLKPEQVKRLKQIALQQRGAGALADAEIQKTLKITDEQKAKLKTITDDAAKARADIGRGEGAGEKMAALRKDTLTKSEAVFNADQTKAWKDMVGASFEIKMEPRKPREGKPERKPADTKPATTAPKPATTKPLTTKPATTKPADTKSTKP